MRLFFAIAVAFGLCVSAEPISRPISFSSRKTLFTRRAEADAILASRSITDDAASFSNTSYDFLIVGAGTAGLALAARLSESGKYTVGVLEAGISGLGVPIIDIPGDFGADLGTIYDWNYTTQPGSGSTAEVPAVHWPKGKGLGGTSILNDYLWNRASAAEYDAWEQLGNPGWNWDSMYSYMKKAEHFHAPSEQITTELGLIPTAADFGNSGPIQVIYARYVAKASQVWLAALESLGIPTNRHALAGSNIGGSQFPNNINPINNTRSYSASAYLFPNANRKNLAVLTSALVEKINWSTNSHGGNPTASGVTFISGGQEYSVIAKKEVIISGGSVNTPQILELSGIGAQDVLTKAGVKQVVNLPNVGENLQEHVLTAIVHERSDNGITFDTLHANATYAAEQLALYRANSSDPPSILDAVVPTLSYVSLSTLVGADKAKTLVAEAATYVNSVNASYKATLQHQIAYLETYADTVSQVELVTIDGFFATTGTNSPNKTYTSFNSAIQHPLSRGTIHIQSNNASVYPIISPNYFSAPFDVQVATAGTAYLRNIAKTSQYSAFLGAETVPGPGTNLQNFTTTIGFGTEFHPVGTSSMLPRDKGGVVDSSLKVYGTTNVRVVDASIIPLHISAHPQSTIYGIAEKAADIILSAQ